MAVARTLSAAASAPLPVETSDEALTRYRATTLPRATQCAGVVYPTSTEQVVELVRWASAEKVALYPISKGNNWGYGDALAPKDGALIVDLSRMNKISEVNAELAYVVVEPGVTQGQLFDHLERHRVPLWMDGNGAGPDTSLVGNALERGFGHGPAGERASFICGMEVVLGTGEVLRTGFGHYDRSKVHHLYKYGIGPSMDGLFFQSNFGIVTRLGIWLMPQPEAFNAFLFSPSRTEDLGPVVERVAGLRRAGVLRSTVHMGNPLRTIMNRLDYPWNETSGRQPVSEGFIQQARKKYRLGAWTATGAVYGPKRVVRESIREIQRVMKPYRIHVLDDVRMGAFSLAGKLPTPLRQVHAALEPAFGMLKGKPTPAFLRTAAWRSPSARPNELNPIANGAGLMWVVPTFPATARDAEAVHALVEKKLHQHGFDAPMTMTFLNERAMICTTSISFNRVSRADADAAVAAYTDLTQTCIAAGYLPYRSGVGGYDLLKNDSPYWPLAAKLKGVFDPAGIIAPGRYV
jgi:4-cresol dehydrogenase (hydroxylating)